MRKLRESFPEEDNMADKVGDGIKAANASGSFSGKTAETFEEHVAKSVLLYEEGHELVVKLSDFFMKDDSLL